MCKSNTALRFPVAPQGYVLYYTLQRDADQNAYWRYHFKVKDHQGDRRRQGQGQQADQLLERHPERGIRLTPDRKAITSRKSFQNIVRIISVKARQTQRGIGITQVRQFCTFTQVPSIQHQF